MESEHQAKRNKQKGGQTWDPRQRRMAEKPRVCEAGRNNQMNNETIWKLSKPLKNFEMKFFELTSGFLAAVVIALGANHYVSTTTVEEEQVVKEEATRKVNNLHWFDVEEGTGALTYAGTGPDDIPGCNEEEQLAGYIYCSVAFETMTPPVSNISEVISDPSLAEDARYKEPEN